MMSSFTMRPRPAGAEAAASRPFGVAGHRVFQLVAVHKASPPPIAIETGLAHLPFGQLVRLRGLLRRLDAGPEPRRPGRVRGEGKREAPVGIPRLDDQQPVAVSGDREIKGKLRPVRQSRALGLDRIEPALADGFEFHHGRRAPPFDDGVHPPGYAPGRIRHPLLHGQEPFPPGQLRLEPAMPPASLLHGRPALGRDLPPESDQLHDLIAQTRPGQ